MKISFVIPAHNEEKYIGQCLDSILRQAKKSSYEFEIIVVNNASVDRTAEIVSAYPGVRLVNESRKGLPYARQAGFLASRYSLIANIDADIIMNDGWIDKAIKEFSQDKKLAALSGPYIYHDLSRATNILVWSYYALGFIFSLFNQYILRAGAMIQGGNFVLRRSALDSINGFDTSIDFYGEDTDIARRIMKAGRVKFSFLFPINTSGRRLKGEGVIKMGIKYFANHFWVIIFRKPLTKKHQVIR
jgi:glycosyltransferase involved in cell wall biosynthesis